MQHQVPVAAVAQAGFVPQLDFLLLPEPLIPLLWVAVGHWDRLVAIRFFPQLPQMAGVLAAHPIKFRRL